MKAAVVIARVLLGLIFVFFGSNLILQFLHLPLPPGDAGEYTRILAVHNVMRVVGLIEVIGGVLLLVGRFVPLGLTILAPVIINILLFHTLIDLNQGIVPGLVCAVLEFFLLFAYRESFYTLFHADPPIFTRP